MTKIPSLVAILVLLVASFSATFAITQFHEFRSSAEIIFTPKDLKITNIKDTSFTVSWVTDKPAIGFVEYTNESNEKKLSAPTITQTAHLITINGLKPNTSYSFRINSAGQYFDNNAANWTVTTTSFPVSSDSSIISGRVFNSKNLPAKNAIVYADIGNAVYSTIVTQSGNWVISLPSLPETQIINLLIEDSPSVVSWAKIDLKSANPVPTIVLGNSYDFRNQTNIPEGDVPNVPILLPQN